MKRIRKQVGLTQEELSQKSGFAVPTLSRWENNVRSPKQKDVAKLAAAMGVSLEKLLLDNALDHPANLNDKASALDLLNELSRIKIVSRQRGIAKNIASERHNELVNLELMRNRLSSYNLSEMSSNDISDLIAGTVEIIRDMLAMKKFESGVNPIDEIAKMLLGEIEKSETNIDLYSSYVRAYIFELLSSIYQLLYAYGRLESHIILEEGEGENKKRQVLPASREIYDMIRKMNNVG